ncbi:erythropoietin receptor [Mixophyes fleayi]|uniref:erythropoietin receptor n=1 Tax=Mixophyes fleayi TaxID=3061075 RepID=UPI003F4DEB9A
MGVWTPQKSQSLYGGSLLLVTWIILCSGTEERERPALTTLIPSVYNVIENKSVVPFCFAITTYELTCFWESNASDVSNYTFYYQKHAQHEVVRPCSLTMVPASNDTWWHICQAPEGDIDLFSISPYVVEVMDSCTNTTIYKREVFPETVVYIEPLQIVTVMEQRKPLGLVIIVRNPSKDILMNNMFIYQVNYSGTESKIQKSETIVPFQVDTENVKLFLSGVFKGTVYTVSVRVKAKDSYDGYWSEWSVVDVQTSNGVDELHIVLYVVVGLVPVAVIVLMFFYHGKFLKSKAWPKIPTPEHHFKELYTTHKGNFKLWLDQTDSYLMWLSRNIFHEGPISTVEVLSELPNAAPSLPPSVQLPPKDSYVILDENMLPHFSSWVVSQGQVDARREEPSTAVVPSQENLRKEEGPKEYLCMEDMKEVTREEEHAVDDGVREVPSGVPGCRNVVREDSLNSEEGKQSPGSSFEYTVLETYDGLLSPRACSIPPRQPLKYACLLMPDSGDEASPPSSNIYQNSPCTQFLAPVYSQC